MLSRTAEYLYWISRYMERAETTARLLDVGYRMSLFPNPRGYNNEWESVLAASGAIESYKKKYNDKDNVPRPSHWSGWNLTPSTIEFWLDGDNRIHERLKYSLDKNGSWTKSLLSP